MTITIDPNAFGVALFPWTMLMTLLGLIGALFYMQKAARGLRVSQGAMYRLMLRVVFWALLGARIFHTLDYAGFYGELPLQIFYLWNGGLSLWGALIVGGAGALWHVRHWGLHRGMFAVQLTIAGLIAIAVGRLGDFLVGERIGAPTLLPWGVTYANGDSESFGFGATHPVALYEMLLASVVLACIARWRWSGISDETVLQLTVGAYAVGRFLIAMVTVAPAHFAFAQVSWVSLLLLLLIVAYQGLKRVSLCR